MTSAAREKLILDLTGVLKRSRKRQRPKVRSQPVVAGILSANAIDKLMQTL